MTPRRVNNKAYFESLTTEINALKGRIQHFIGDAHWLSDGEWRESILRSILRRYFPSTLNIGRGFIITDDGPSTQIDILIYDNTKPILFKDGDFVLVTPDATVGVIEVKKRVKRTELKKVLEKINEIASLHRRQPSKVRPSFGLFIYEDFEYDYEFYLKRLKSVFNGNKTMPLHILSLGESDFIRFREFDPYDQRKQISKWHAYKLLKKAPAYFLHNVIDFSCKFSMSENDLWFPYEGKEVHLVGSIEME